MIILQFQFLDKESINRNNNNNTKKTAAAAETTRCLSFTTNFLSPSIFCPAPCPGRLTQLTIIFWTALLSCFNQQKSIAKDQMSGREEDKDISLLVSSPWHGGCCIYYLFYGTASISQFLFFVSSSGKTICLIFFFCTVLTFLSEI